jgi:hypothetical protein
MKETNKGLSNKQFSSRINPIRVLKRHSQMTGFLRFLKTLYYYDLTFVSGFKI